MNCKFLHIWVKDINVGHGGGESLANGAIGALRKHCVLVRRGGRDCFAGIDLLIIDWKDFWYESKTLWSICLISAV